MKIPPAHEFIQFRDFHTRLNFALDDEMRESLAEQSAGFDLFVRLVNQYRVVESTMIGRERRRVTTWVPR